MSETQYGVQYSRAIRDRDGNRVVQTVVTGPEALASAENLAAELRHNQTSAASMGSPVPVDAVLVQRSATFGPWEPVAEQQAEESS